MVIHVYSEGRTTGKKKCRVEQAAFFLIADINLVGTAIKSLLLQFAIEKKQRALVSFLRSLNPHSGIDSLLDNKLDIPKCVQVASLSTGTSPTASPAKLCSFQTLFLPTGLQKSILYCWENRYYSVMCHFNSESQKEVFKYGSSLYLIITVQNESWSTILTTTIHTNRFRRKPFLDLSLCHL